MDPVEYFEAGRWLEAELVPAPEPEPAVPAGCRGLACPFFVQCQGRCEDKLTARQRDWPAAPLPAEHAAAR